MVELLVATVMLAALVGVLVTAVQKVRERSVRLQSEDNLRRIGVGLHLYAAAKQGRLPGESDPDLYTDLPDGSPLMALIKYVEGCVPMPTFDSAVMPNGVLNPALLYPRQLVYVSPGDPTVPLWDGLPGPTRPSDAPLFHDTLPPTSYAENMLAFTGPPTLARSFADGTSNTIAFAERYAIGRRFEQRSGPPCHFSYSMGGPWWPRSGVKVNPPKLDRPRRSTFADRGWRDVVPVTDNGVTRASVPGKTFQVRPPPEQADGSVVQTPFAGGLPVALFDGSVRTVSPRVSEAVFWAAVTPAGGETAPLD